MLSVIQELESEIKQMASLANRGAASLLRHIYDKHPPPAVEGQPARRLSAQPNSSNTRPLLKAALCHYHTDMAKRCGWTLRQEVLNEEIFKLLNEKYKAWQ